MVWWTMWLERYSMIALGVSGTLAAVWITSYPRHTRISKSGECGSVVFRALQCIWYQRKRHAAAISTQAIRPSYLERSQSSCLNDAVALRSWYCVLRAAHVQLYLPKHTGTGGLPYVNLPVLAHLLPQWLHIQVCILSFISCIA